MRRLVWKLPEQLIDALHRSTGTRVEEEKPAWVLVAGMGGSAIGGDMVGAVLAERWPVPFRVWRDYRLPAIAGKDTLFFAVSYSGNTEETLAAYEQAVRRRCRIVAVTSGGELSRRAEQRGQLLFRLPLGFPPRAALGYLLVPLAVVLEQTGVAVGLTSQLRRSAALLRRRRKVWWRRAGRIARTLLERLPIVYSASRLLDPAADRWRCQLNENAKVMCHTAALPEHNHNEIVGMGSPGQLSRSVLVFLLDRHTHPRTLKRAGETVKITRGTFEKVCQLKTEGIAPLERLLSLCMQGDMVSVELARLRGVDPLPVARIDLLKERMRSRR